MKVSKPERYIQDPTGQWWYVTKKGVRKRATLKNCPQCGEEFLVDKPFQVHCSHSCAGAAMHKGRPITTPDPPKKDELINGDNPRYYKDANDQWWYQPGGPKQHSRTRAHIKTCRHCKRKYLISIYHNKNQGCCSRSCGMRVSCKKNPGRYAGDKGSNWKGGRMVQKGYVWLWSPDHPSRTSTTKPYVLEHRLVMEKILGRFLEPHEIVHHKNGVKDDNRPENLELWENGRHPWGQRTGEVRHCPTCTCNK